MQLFKGAPHDVSGRTTKEAAVYKLFDSLNIQYERVDHEEAMTMEACLAIESVLGAKMCKNLFLRNEQKTKFYLLIMPGDKKFKTKDLSKQINSARLSFAEAEFMQDLLNLTPGSVSITGLMNDTQLKVSFLADEDVLKEEYVGIHPNINTSSIKIKTSDIQKYLDAIGHTVTIVKL